MITPGIFLAQVKSHTWTRSQSGTTGLKVTVTIVEGTADGEEMTGTVWFSEKSMRMGRAQLKSLGFDVDKNPLKAIGTNISLVGNECRIQVKDEEYKGERQLKIGFFMSKDETPPEADLDAIEKSLRGAKSEPKKLKPKAASASPMQEEDEAGDDTIPF